jgi:hypothetical protein
VDCFPQFNTKNDDEHEQEREHRLELIPETIGTIGSAVGTGRVNRVNWPEKASCDNERIEFGLGLNK